MRYILKKTFTRDIHMDRYTHEAIYTWEQYIHEKNIYTKEKMAQKDIDEGNIYIEGTNLRRDI